MTSTPRARAPRPLPRLSLRPLAALIAGLLAAAAAQAQTVPPEPSAPAPEATRTQDALLMLDYQSIRVPGDAPIDLMGFHVHHQVRDGLYLGAGVYAPLLKGEYGGFMAFDVGAHVRQPLGGAWFATAGLSGGGGGGGRSMEQSKVLSGTGGFVKGYVGLGHDFGAFSVGANVAKMRFRHSVIDSTQANVFVELPYRYLTGPFDRHGEALGTAEARQAAGEGRSENLLTATLDNYHQIDPQGSNKDTVRAVDLQFSHFLSADTYWFAALGVGYRGLPIYNQMLGGLGRRWPLAPGLAAYTQIGLGSGGYAPEIIDTDAGLLVYPRLSVEYALSPSLGLGVSAGYLMAPKGSSRNATYGLALTHHLRSGRDGDAAAPTGAPRWQGFRVGLFQQTELGVRYRDIDRDHLQMVGVQVDAPLGGRWYLPLQAAVAYSAYLGYPGYGELLAGLGVQTLAAPGDKLQAFGQVMGGANVHGLGAKASAGVRYLLNERLALQLNAGHFEARSRSGAHYTAHSVGLGLDYRFAVPVR